MELEQRALQALGRHASNRRSQSKCLLGNVPLDRVRSKRVTTRFTVQGLCFRVDPS